MNIEDAQSVLVKAKQHIEESDAKSLHVDFILSKDSSTKEINITARMSFFDVKDIIKLQKILGVSKIEKRVSYDKSFMSGVTRIEDVGVWIYPKNDVFNGCRLVEKEVIIPATPEHVAKLMVVECGSDKS